MARNKPLGKVSKKERSDKNNLSNDNKILGFITTFLSIVGFILALLLWKDNDYVMFYAKQSLAIFIVVIIGYGASLIPIIGLVIGSIVYLIFILFWILSWVFALSGEKRDVFFIGEYAKMLKV